MTWRQLFAAIWRPGPSSTSLTTVPKNCHRERHHNLEQGIDGHRWAMVADFQ